MLAVALVALVGVPLAQSPPAGAALEGPVVFQGAGWGHGVGLSQYGAFGMSREGFSAEQIVRHYYTGASVRTLEFDLPAAAPLWVNLERNLTSLELSVGGGSARVVHDGAAHAVPAESRIAVRALGSSQCELTISTPTGTQTVRGGCWLDVIREGAAFLEIQGCRERDWTTEPVVDRPCRYRHGIMHVRPASASAIHLVLEIGIEDYLLGIAEMPYWWGRPEEGGAAALQAQAIAARSYAHHLQISRGDPSTSICGGWCHVRDTTWDQRYVGDDHGGADRSNWEQAVASTRGRVLTHPLGNAKPLGIADGIVLAYYSSSTGGRTEEQAEVWAGGQIPYLRSVDDHWSLLGINPNSSWRVEVSSSTVAQRVGLDRLDRVAVTAVRTSGSTAEVQFTGWIGSAPATVTRSGGWVASTFGLRSQYFSLEAAGFVDIGASVHGADIEALAEAGITRGCNPPAGDRFCPEDPVTRGQMAAFLVRTTGLAVRAADPFIDDDGSIFEEDIERLAAAGITAGCTPEGDRFCPDEPVTRGQMAAFLVRTLGLTEVSRDWFTDDEGSMFEQDINRLRTAGITLGCNPPAGDRYCPERVVTREQMASFLVRAFLA